jgi:hypothetical protein
MTRAEVDRTLMRMESIRMDAMEAESAAEERRLNAEYDRLWKAIQPYVSGSEPYSDPTPTAPNPGQPAPPVIPPRTPEDGRRPSTPEDGQPVTTR